MTKIVCVGDIHVSDRAPANATDSYTDDIIEMLRWIADWARENEADAVVWAGDVFHHKAPGRNSHELVLKMLDLVEYHQVPLYCVTGNHDVMHGIMDNVHSRQPLGVLYRSGLRELVGWHPTLPIYGVPWREDWTQPGAIQEAFKDWRNVPEDTPVLAIAHAPIYPPSEEHKQLFEMIPTSGPDGVSAAMGNHGFLHYGHIHEDHGIFEVDGVTYCNLGAISRGSLHEYNLNRKIQVAVWTDGTDGIEALSNPVPAGFTKLDVPHKPAKEVFRIAEATQEKVGKLNLEEFLSEVGTRTINISSTATVIQHIRDRQDVSEKVKRRAITILENME